MSPAKQQWFKRCMCIFLLSCSVRGNNLIRQVPKEITSYYKNTYIHFFNLKNLWIMTQKSLETSI